MSIKKIFNLVLCTLIALNLFFLSSIVSYQITLSGEMVTLPDLVGYTLEEGKLDLAKKKLSIVQSGVQLHERLDRGKIIYQEPAPGSKIKANAVVKVILSAGREKVIVVKLTGTNLESVTQILRDSGLRKGKVSYIHTPKYAAGKIIAQFPLELEEVGRDSQVDFLVSQGEEEPKYLMPDLLGKRASTLIKKLKDLEFRIGDLRYSFYPGLESGIIIKQYPPQGFRVQKRNLITLEVSK